MDDIVRCSGGITIAQRDSRPVAGEADYTVGPVAPVLLPNRAPLESRLSDGHVWRRHWTAPDRLIIEFVSVANVEIDTRRGTVTFDRELTADMEQHLLFDHVLSLLLANRGRLVVHGAVLGRDGRAVVLVGASGAGKSTLTAFAWRHGWTIGGDDGAVLFPTDPPTAESTYSTIRLTPESFDMLGLDRSSAPTILHKFRLADADTPGFSQERFDLGLIAIINPGGAGDDPRFEPIRGALAHARIFGSTFHSDFEGDQLLPSVMDAIASIVDQITVGYLTVPRGLDGLAATEQLLRRLIDPQIALTATTLAGPAGEAP